MYQLTRDGRLIKRLSDGAFIPVDEKNSAYIEFKEWQDKGNAPQAADPEFTPSQIQEKGDRKNRKKAIMQKLGLTKQEVKSLAELVSDANDD